MEVRGRPAVKEATQSDAARVTSEEGDVPVDPPEIWNRGCVRSFLWQGVTQPRTHFFINDIKMSYLMVNKGEIK